MVNASHEPELDVQISGNTFVVQRQGAEIRVGSRTGDGVVWQGETVPLDALPADARAALEAGDTSSNPLTLALQGVIDAFAQRGG